MHPEVYLSMCRKFINQNGETTMHLYKIEKNVPIPRRVSSTISYPFIEMDVDDSFFVPALTKDEDLSKLRVKVYSACVYFRKSAAKYNDLKFMVIQIPENNGVRCWRVR